MDRIRRDAWTRVRHGRAMAFSDGHARGGSFHLRTRARRQTADSELSMAQSLSPVPEQETEKPPLPDHVTVTGAARFSANELRQIRAVSGKSMEQLMEDGADVIQASAYISLRKKGYALSWDEAGDIPVEFVEEPADPS